MIRNWSSSSVSSVAASLYVNGAHATGILYAGLCVYSTSLKSYSHCGKSKDRFKMIGCGLYFHHLKTGWKGSVSAYPNFLLALTEPNAQELNEPVVKMATLAEELFINELRYGKIQDVFSYQV